MVHSDRIVSEYIYRRNVITFNLKHLHDDSDPILNQDTQIKEVTNITFLGLGTEKNMERNTDIEQIVALMSTAAC